MKFYTLTAKISAIGHFSKDIKAIANETQIQNSFTTFYFCHKKNRHNKGKGH
jgi:hypothetical protein